MKLETIRVYHQLQQALVARSYLESKRIQVIIPDEHTSVLGPEALGSGVRLQVPFEDAEQAEAMLAEAGL